MKKTGRKTSTPASEAPDADAETKMPEVKTVKRRVLALTQAQVSQLVADNFIDPDFYRARYSLSIPDDRVFAHFLNRSSRDGRSYSARMNVRAYLDAYPDVAESGQSPILHYLTEGRQNGYEIVPHERAEGTMDLLALEIEDEKLEKMLDDGFVDPDYYRARYGSGLSDDEVLDHFINRSAFDARSYSAKVDSIGYLMTYHDVMHSDQSATLHYFDHGQYERRQVADRWKNFSWISRELEYTPAEPPEDDTAPEIAIHLHIYYPDYIERFYEVLSRVPFEFDLLISSPVNLIAARSQVFSTLSNVRNLIVKTAENRGRNFGPLLVDFREELQDYDFVLHMHSKKSLYSGKEQASWAMYNQIFLAGDGNVALRHLEVMRSDEDIAILSLTPFIKIPYWGSHSLKNSGALRQLGEKIGVEMETGFQNYPLGGMMWFRPDKLTRLLEYPWSYDDFPDEVGQTDGTLQHALERGLPAIAAAEGGRTVYYEPASNKYALNGYDTFALYRTETRTSLVNVCQMFDVVSCDVFDTIIYRQSMDTEIGKKAVGERLRERGVVDSVEAFLRQRNETEYDLRRQSDFRGDVALDEIYLALAGVYGLSAEDAADIGDLEFSADLADQRSRPVVVTALNEALRETGGKLVFVSDTYYSRLQVTEIIKKAGISVAFDVFASSDIQARKDNGTVWQHLLARYNCKPHEILHLGDNLVSDNQIPTELGFATFYIMDAMQKFAALTGAHAFPKEILEGDSASYWLKTIEAVGADPFFSHAN